MGKKDPGNIASPCKNRDQISTQGALIWVLSYSNQKMSEVFT